MSDIRTVWDAAVARGDWMLSEGALLTGADLSTAMLVSVFTDAMAAPDDVIPDGTGDPRGWWGDQFDPDAPLGSKLWLLEREKQTQTTLNRAYDYLAEALRWLIDDGVVARFDISVALQCSSSSCNQVERFAANDAGSSTASSSPC